MLRPPPTLPPPPPLQTEMKTSNFLVPASIEGTFPAFLFCCTADKTIFAFECN